MPLCALHVNSCSTRVNSSKATMKTDTPVLISVHRYQRQLLLSHTYTHTRTHMHTHMQASHTQKPCIHMNVAIHFTCIFGVIVTSAEQEDGERCSKAAEGEGEGRNSGSEGGRKIEKRRSQTEERTGKEVMNTLC